MRLWSLVALLPLLLLLAAPPVAGQPRPPFAIGGHTVVPGTRADLDLAVPAGRSDGATRVPVTVFHGARPGPVLALTAGVHGFEFVPILAAQRLLARIDPATLSGTVLLVRIAHVEAFEQRVPYVNPFDRKNLNRVFPGQADGTQAERIAWAITTEASIGFLGFGDPDVISWGSIIYDAFASQAMYRAPWWVAPPGVAIMVLVSAVYLVGREYERVINPRLAGP